MTFAAGFGKFNQSLLTKESCGLTREIVTSHESSPLFDRLKVSCPTTNRGDSFAKRKPCSKRSNRS